MSLSPQVREKIETLVRSNPVMLFMKGTREGPQCGFSAQVVRILDGLVPSYSTYDVLSDPLIRDGIKEYSDWPTIPQLYIGGEFQGGCDIVLEMYGNGELHTALGLERSTAKVPNVTLTPAAGAVISRAQRGDAEAALHLAIDARYQYQLGFGPAEGGEIQVESAGLTILLSPESARRADGLVIDAVETPQGPRLSIDNPNEPSVEELPPAELKGLADAGASFVLIDVRPAEERALAQIEGARPLDDAATRAHLEALPRDARIVFHCHSGGRSRAVAKEFATQGFKNVANLAGGIDAWSRDIDPSVPRY